MEPRSRGGGSRFLYEPFDTAHARIEVLERIMAEQERSFDQKAKAAAIDGRRRLGAFDQVYR